MGPTSHVCGFYSLMNYKHHVHYFKGTLVNGNMREIRIDTNYRSLSAREISICTSCELHINSKIVMSVGKAIIDIATFNVKTS